MKCAFVTLCSRYILFAVTMEILPNQVSDDSHIAPLSKNYMVQVKDFLQKWQSFFETYRNKLYINF